MLKINEPIALAEIFIVYLRHLTTAVDNSEILPKMKILKRAADQLFFEKFDLFVLTVISVSSDNFWATPRLHPKQKCKIGPP